MKSQLVLLPGGEIFLSWGKAELRREQRGRQWHSSGAPVLLSVQRLNKAVLCGMQEHFTPFLSAVLSFPGSSFTACSAFPSLDCPEQKLPLDQRSPLGQAMLWI